MHGCVSWNRRDRFSVMIKAIRLLKNRVSYAAPKGMQCGMDVRIQRPHRISNPRHISVGDRTTIGRDALIAPILEYANVHYSPTVIIGKDVYIGPHLYLSCVGSVAIGDGTVLSENVFINDSTHGFDPECGLIMQQQLVHAGNIVIGKNCFLGLRTAILPGVILGDHCIVGVNSVVTRSFPAYSMIAGSPATLIKQYSLEEKRWIREKR